MEHCKNLFIEPLLVENHNNMANVFDMYCYPEDLLDLHYNTNHSVAKLFFYYSNCIIYHSHKSETHVRKNMLGTCLKEV